MKGDEIHSSCHIYVMILRPLRMQPLRMQPWLKSHMQHAVACLWHSMTRKCALMLISQGTRVARLQNCETTKHSVPFPTAVHTNRQRDIVAFESCASCTACRFLGGRTAVGARKFCGRRQLFNVFKYVRGHRNTLSFRTNDFPTG